MGTTRQPNPQETIERITARGEQIRRRELETALDGLQAHGDLTPGQRAAVETLSTTLVEELLAVPVEAIERAPEDDEALAACLRLFPPDDG